MDHRVRWAIYLVFAIALSIPLITGWQVPPDVGPEARQMYAAIERVPPDKIVLLNAMFEGSSLAENGPQTSALIAHLMKRGKRFAIVGLDAIGPGLAQEIAEKAAGKYHRPYGETWCNWGYKLALPAVVMGLARDLPGSVVKDIKGTAFASIPAMKGVKRAEDVGLVIDISPTSSFSAWLMYFTGPHHVPLAVAPTSVMISEIYPFMNTGQIVGMLKGIAGAAQYERLIDEPGDGYKNRMPVFMAHAVIIGLILLGNLGEILRRRRLR